MLLAEGWAGTTMTAVAARAGVSAQLLYKTFGTKVALAKRLYDVTLMGDDEPVPLHERPEIAAITAEPDPRRTIARYVGLALTVERGVDAVWTLLAPEVFQASAAGRGWSYADIEAFLTDQVVAALLGE